MSHLKVHESDMNNATSVKNLGDIVTSKGGSHDTIEHRRSGGWGRVFSLRSLQATSEHTLASN